MSSVKIGLFTIGQSPREDVTSEMKLHFLSRIEIVEEGLLDDMPPEEIDLFKPEFTEIPLVTRLRDGSQVELSEQKIGSLFHDAIDRMRTHKDVRAVGVLCTHDFQETRFSFPVIFPHHHLNYLITQAFQINILGVVVPLENQVEMAKRKWEAEKVIAEVKSPYVKGKSWEDIAQRFKQDKAEVVILDCIGYTIQDKEQLQNRLASPILLPRTVLAHAINQIF